MNLDKLLNRYYTKALENSDKSVFDLFEWKKVDIKLNNFKTGEVIFEQTELEFPKDYSQNACDIIATKYFRKKGLDNDEGMETSLREVADRMVSFWVESMLDENLIEQESKQIVYDELVFMFLSQNFAPNSPQWFNTGLKKYGINGAKSGHFYYDEATNSVKESEDSYTRTQGSACFIISVDDKLIGEKSLTDQITTETLLFKYGSGVGTNWSTIRSENESLSGGGKSSGLLSFLKVSDRNAGAIKSGGTTRRAAKMNILNVDHPEIEKFINWKTVEEEKVRALAKMGYSTSIDGEAYETVSGQNANNSIRISNEFMNALNGDDKWVLNGVSDKDFRKQVSARELWEQNAKATWACGDPGVQYDSIINDWHTCPYGEDGQFNAKHNRINASNPCSEYMFLDDTACNLASINILNYYDVKTKKFDIEGYLHSIKLIQMVLEATIHFGQFPTRDIARKSYEFRTTGLGLTNMGMLVMTMALPYDSDESRNVLSCLTSIMTGYSYHISALMAEKVGPFMFYDINKNSMQKVIKNHGVVAGAFDEFEDLSYEPLKVDHEVLNKLMLSDISKTLKEVWIDAKNVGEQHGFRNAQVSVLAPTGTIAFAMDCGSTSSEPFFSHVAFKKLVGGGFMEIINPAIENALRALGYGQDQIDDIVEYVLRKDENGMTLDGKIEGAPHLLEEHLHIFDTASKCGSGERYLTPMAHVKMMGALTPCVSGAISKTVNMPNEATPDDIKDIYEKSYELGVKAIAIYRDGCKAGQPLNAVKQGESKVKLEDLTYDELLNYAKNRKETHEKPNRLKPSGIRTAKVHEAEVNGLKLYITTSFYDDGRLGEIYVSSGRQGTLTKGLLDSVSTTISKMLQYNIPAEDIARMFRGQKYEPYGFVTGHPFIKYVDSISDLISKIIDIELGNFDYCQVKPDKYITEESSEKEIEEVLNKEYTFKDYLHSEVCSNCGSNKLVKNGTCKVCTVCGTTTGCS